MSKRNSNLFIVVSLLGIALAFFLFVFFITGHLMINNFNLATTGTYIFYGYILVVVFLIIPLGIWYLSKKDALRSLYGLVFIIGIGFAIMIPIAARGEYVPSNNLQTLKESDDMSVILDRIS